MAEETGFDVLITTDKGIRYQQNLSGRGLALVLIHIWKWKPVIVDAISDVSPGSFREVEMAATTSGGAVGY